MPSINHVILSGRIIEMPKPELRYYQNGDVSAMFFLSVKNIVKLYDSFKTVYDTYIIIGWKSKVENIEKIIKVNNILLVVGHLKRFEKSADKVKDNVYIVADEITYLGKLQKEKQNGDIFE